MCCSLLNEGRAQAQAAAGFLAKFEMRGGWTFRGGCARGKCQSSRRRGKGEAIHCFRCWQFYILGNNPFERFVRERRMALRLCFPRRDWLRRGYKRCGSTLNLQEGCSRWGGWTRGECSNPFVPFLLTKGGRGGWVCSKRIREEDGSHYCHCWYGLEGEEG